MLAVELPGLVYMTHLNIFHTNWRGFLGGLLGFFLFKYSVGQINYQVYVSFRNRVIQDKMGNIFGVLAALMSLSIEQFSSSWNNQNCSS